MGKFMSTMSAIGSALEASAARNAEIKELTYKLMSKTQGVEYAQAEAIATVLYYQADITWK